MSSPTELHDIEETVIKPTEGAESAPANASDPSSGTPSETQQPASGPSNDNLKPIIVSPGKGKRANVAFPLVSELLAKVQEDDRAMRTLAECAKMEPEINTENPSISITKPKDVKTVPSSAALHDNPLPAHLPADYSLQDTSNTSTNREKEKTAPYSAASDNTSQQGERSTTLKPLQPSAKSNARVTFSDSDPHLVSRGENSLPEGRQAVGENIQLPADSRARLKQVKSRINERLRRASSGSGPRPHVDSHLQTTPISDSVPDLSEHPISDSVPNLSEHMFSEGNETVDSFDIAVVYICAKEEHNEPEYSAFVFQEPLESASKKPGTSLENKTQDSTRQHSSGQSERSATTRPIRWLEDKNMLPSVLPMSRIMGFGFELDSFKVNKDNYFDSAASKLREALLRKRHLNPGRPLVFIGHGYGTVIIQSLFSRLVGDDSQGVVLKGCTAAIILFAPPFRGSDELINWTMKSSKLPKSMETTLSTQLRDKSLYLQNYWKHFCDVAEDPNIFVFALLSKSARDMEKYIKESNYGEGIKTLTIDDMTKCIDRVSFSSTEIIGDIARFSGPSDRRFLSVVEFISKKVQTRLVLGAAERGDEETLASLIKESFEIYLSNKKQETALHLAARHGHVKFMTAVLSTDSININSPDNEGMTALHRAVLRNTDDSAQIVEELIKFGADRWAGEKNDQVTPTPIMLAEKTETLPSIRRWFKRPPMVEGPHVRVPRKLKKHTPHGDGIAACKLTDVAATEIFHIHGNPMPEKHSLMYHSVYKLIYSDDKESVSQMFESVRSIKFLEETPFCRWYHLPANNMVWVEDLFLKLDIPFYPWPATYREAKLPHSRCMNPQATFLQNLGPSTADRKATVILMPYISYEEFDRQQDVGRLIASTFKDHMLLEKDRLTQEKFVALRNIWKKSTPNEMVHITEEPLGVIDELAVESDNIPVEPRGSLHCIVEGESPVIEADDQTIKSESQYNPNYKDAEQHQVRAYLMHDPPLHPRRTLDQSYYHMLSNTSDRDRDQVVSRWMKRESERAEKEREIYRQDRRILTAKHNILMVDQLWLWRIPGKDESDPDTVITSFPSRTGAHVSPSTNFEETSAEIDDLEETVLRSHNFHPRALIENTDGLVSRILTVCCRTLDRHQQVHTLKFLQMFQSTIGEAEEKETELFGKFRNISNELYCLHEEHRDYQEKRGEKLKELLKIHEESNLLKEVKDIVDEIKMIRVILADQCAVLDDKGLEHVTAEARSLLESTDKTFELMETHAKNVVKGLDHLLELKQMQANLWESRSSREGAEETARQGNTILVFTIVTIIFLPLSFMSSFFAIGIDQFPQDNKGNTAWPLARVCGLLFGISMALSIPLLIIAFNVPRITTPWNYLRRIWIKKVLIQLSKPLRSIPYFGIRAKVYGLVTELSDSLYVYENPSTTPLQKIDYRRQKVKRAVEWRLKDREFITVAESYFDGIENDANYNLEEDSHGGLFDRGVRLRMELSKLKIVMKDLKKSTPQ